MIKESDILNRGWSNQMGPPVPPDMICEKECNSILLSKPECTAWQKLWGTCTEAKAKAHQKDIYDKCVNKCVGGTGGGGGGTGWSILETALDILIGKPEAPPIDVYSPVPKENKVLGMPPVQGYAVIGIVSIIIIILMFKAFSKKSAKK